MTPGVFHTAGKQPFTADTNSLHDPVNLPVLSWRYLIDPLKGSGKMKCIRIPDQSADLTDLPVRGCKKRRCFSHPVMHQKFLGRLSDHSFEDFPKVTAFQLAVFCDILYCNIFFIMCLNISDSFFRIELAQFSVLRCSPCTGILDHPVQQQIKLPDQRHRGTILTENKMPHLFFNFLSMLLRIRNIDRMQLRNAHRLHTFSGPESCKFNPHISPWIMLICHICVFT